MIAAHILLNELAFCRIYRHGQTKVTYLTRFVVQKTIDEYLVKMQMRKKAEIASAVDNRQLLERLTTEDLMSLFGTVKHDEKGRPFIVVDDHELVKESTKHRKEAQVPAGS